SWGPGSKNFTPPAAAGDVTAVNGNTLTVTDKKTGTSFSVDVSNATITKVTPGSNGTAPTKATITASGVAVGDMVMVQGTVSGTTITATEVTDGMMPFGGRGFGRGMGPHGADGTVTAISGNTITLTGKDGKTYTVDASNSKFETASSSSLSNVKVGD